MPRISYDIKEIQKGFREAGIPMGEGTKPTKAMMYQFLRMYNNVDDERCQGMISYALSEIILSAFLAVSSMRGSGSKRLLFLQASLECFL